MRGLQDGTSAIRTGNTPSCESIEHSVSVSFQAQLGAWRGSRYTKIGTKGHSELKKLRGPKSRMVVL